MTDSEREDLDAQALASAFDRWLAEHQVPPERLPQALDEWLDKLRAKRLCSVNRADAT